MQHPERPQAKVKSKDPLRLATTVPKALLRATTASAKDFLYILDSLVKKVG